jgi:fatty acid desaturase
VPPVVVSTSGPDEALWGIRRPNRRRLLSRPRRLHYAAAMTFAERRAMWREKRRMRKFWRTRIVAALAAVALNIWAWFGGSDWMEAVALAVLALLMFPFWSSDRRVETEWKARQAARRSDAAQE